jgi:hypothetical protein
MFFTNKSMIRQDINLGGIWRHKAEQLDEARYMKMAREISVMIWGVISNEFPSKLM